MSNLIALLFFDEALNPLQKVFTPFTSTEVDRVSEFLGL
jgi:hypothetical protein